METIIADVNWLAVIVGAVVAFIIGWAWYSPSMFGTKWAQATGIDMAAGGPMSMAMLAQVVSTFLLAWVIGVTETMNSLWFAGLITLTIAGLIKANGLFAQKSKYAVAVESGYILVAVAAMIVVHAVL